MHSVNRREYNPFTATGELTNAGGRNIVYFFDAYVI